MKKIEFVKTYSRDNCFIIQEVWYRQFLLGANGKNNPYLPVEIFYINDGIVEIWENKRSIDWFADALLERNITDDNFFKESIKKYKIILKKLRKYWENGKTGSVKELKNFIRLIEEGTKYFLIYYYSAVDKRTPDHIKKIAMQVRSEDSFYDDSDKVIRNTIHELYPKVSYDLALSVVESELEKLPSIDNLKKRNKNCVLIPNNFLKITKLSEFLKSNRKFNFVLDKIGKKKINSLKGQVAFKGLINGRVKILKNKSKIKNFNEGEILVSPMTTPIFLPAMKKAGAIITDEGGITCHAAIVSRELGKPCIIGTKIATQVLKDGDSVEVDANKGIVKIIKN